MAALCWWVPARSAGGCKPSSHVLLLPARHREPWGRLLSAHGSVRLAGCFSGKKAKKMLGTGRAGGEWLWLHGAAHVPRRAARRASEGKSHLGRNKSRKSPPAPPAAQCQAGWRRPKALLSQLAASWAGVSPGLKTRTWRMPGEETLCGPCSPVPPAKATLATATSLGIPTCIAGLRHG